MFISVSLFSLLYSILPRSELEADVLGFRGAFQDPYLQILIFLYGLRNEDNAGVSRSFHVYSRASIGLLVVLCGSMDPTRVDYHASYDSPLHPLRNKIPLKDSGIFSER